MLILIQSLDNSIIYPRADHSYESFRVCAVGESWIGILHTGVVPGLVFFRGGAEHGDAKGVVLLENGTEIQLRAGDRYQSIWGCSELFYEAVYPASTNNGVPTGDGQDIEFQRRKRVKLQLS
jgi:hypothetical protein